MSAYQPLIGLSTGNVPEADWNGGPPTLDRDGQYRLYAEAVAQGGGMPFFLPLLRSSLELEADDEEIPGPSTCGPGALHENARLYMERLDGLVLTGGGDVGPSRAGSDPGHFHGVDRSRDAWESALLASALDLGRPVLGLCRGVQLLNSALGGINWDDLPSERPGPVEHRQATPRWQTAHQVVLEEGSRLHRLIGRREFAVNSHHHQAVREPAPALKAVAQSPDGLIEALEHQSASFVLGVQWHPETLTQRSPEALALFQGLARAAASGR